MIVTPLVGMWLSSSLAAYHNRSIALCIGFGMLLFPILPFLWDRVYLWRDAKKNPDRKRVLTRVDRLVIRTLVINLSFIVGILAVAPSQAFRAISTRGDWVFDGHDGAISKKARKFIFRLADALEGQWDRANNRYGESDAAPEFQQEAETEAETKEDDSKKQELEEDIAEGVATNHWPLKPEIHTAVRDMPESVQDSYEDVAQYLQRRFDDPFELTRAIHDFIILRLSYDYELLAIYDAGDRSNYRSQQAEDVFASRTAVCEGYARLMRKMGEEAGLEMAYIVGNARFLMDESEGDLHAWNAVKIEGRHYLIDVTWDDDKAPKSRDISGTDYLNTPPELFGVDHFPEDPAWQLRTPPLTIGEFMRQPNLRPDFAAYGLEMISPNRSQVTVSGTLQMEIGNPRGVSMLASWELKAGARDRKGPGTDCNVTGGDLVKISCKFPSDGEYLVTLFANHAKYGSYGSVAQQLVNSN
jgi:hypothetical protein